MQVWFGTADFEMNYKSIPTETDAEIIGCGILTCMSIVSPLILLRLERNTENLCGSVEIFSIVLMVEVVTDDLIV